MMTFEIRPAHLGDAAALTDLLVDSGWFQHYFDAIPAEALREQVEQRLQANLADSSHSLYVAGNGAGELAGYVAVHWLAYLFLPGPEGYVSELFVRNSARSQGIGGRLLAAVKTEAAQRGCSRLSLLNMRTRESYQRGFYAGQGWTERTDAANFVLRLP